MHDSAMYYGQKFFEVYCSKQQFIKVLDIGSQDVNGSLRSVAPERCEYIGIDFTSAKGVQVVLDDPYILPIESDSIDVVVSSSCFEHVEFFWLMFIEIQRVLKPNGLFYLNVPSNGSFHQYPVDCWRFYPDSGVALSNWGRKNGFMTKLLESFVGDQQTSEWNDLVAVFVKDEAFADQFSGRISSITQTHTNAQFLDENGQYMREKCERLSQDQRRLKLENPEDQSTHYKQVFRQNKGNISDKWTSYLVVYDELLKSYKDKPVKILEFGIQNGGSLDIYASYFSNAQLIVGNDINPDCLKIRHDDRRIKTIVGNCTEEITIQAIKQLSPSYDIIIDDASHVSEDIIKTFMRFFPLLNDNGIYIIEDLCCSYWEDFDGGLFHEKSSMAFFKALVDVMNHEHWGVESSISDFISTKFGFVGEIQSNSLQGIAKIQFHNSMCIISKNIASSDSGIGLRAISGTKSIVRNNAKNGSDKIFMDQSNNIHATSLNAEVLNIPRTVLKILHPTCEKHPRYLSGFSAWSEHIPFAFQLMSMHKPRCLVELGTHYGDSYFAFCEAVVINQLDTQCYAIDTWAGDEHAGYYDSDVFDIVQSYNEKHYKKFSTLIRSTFNTALNEFQDGQIDLLHIDGLHSYEAVKQDFDNWLPKMSKQGVILFHDTQVRVRDFGVWKLWYEVSQRYPNFEFLHGHGLGVLGAGTEIPKEMQKLFDIEAIDKSFLFAVFASLGKRVVTNDDSPKLFKDSSQKQNKPMTLKTLFKKLRRKYF